VLIFFHGGGWVKGSRQEYGWAARAYASKGFVVVVPDYRKVPQVRFPAFVEDAADAVRWTKDNIAKYGGDPDRIAVAGHSAGGFAVAMLTLDRQWLAKAGAPDAIKAAVGLSGPYDFYPFTGRAVAAMGEWPRPQETQPLTFARTDAPPMMLVTGTTDTTVRPKNARNLAAKLKALGATVELKEYAAQGHEDIAMALSLPFRGKSPVLEDTAQFLNAHLAKAARPAQ
jgi:acetyl esterase/lipase